MRSRIPAFAVAVAAASFIACFDKPNPTAPSGGDSVELVTGQASASAKLKSVTVQPASASVPAGQTVQLTATSKPAGATFVWATSNQAVATVSQAGLVTGVSP